MKKLLPLVIMALMGAGCWESSQPQTQTPALVPPTSSTSAVSSPEKQSAPVTNVDLPVIDQTWRTYTSRKGDFSFKWPTKGRYAPTWEVSLSAENPCKGTETYSTESGIVFCHVSTIVNPQTGGDLPPAGTTSFLDTYSMSYDEKYLVVTFKKDGAYEIDEATYQAHLNQIMGTFKMDKK